MNIGIDIDGVLTDKETYELENGKEFFGFEAPNPEGYEVEDKFGVTAEEGKEFWRQHFIDYARFYPARENASFVTQKLHEEDYKIFIITARHYQDNFSEYMYPDEMESLVDRWLKDNEIYFDELLLPGDSKIETVTKCNLSYMIEDCPKNIMDLSSINPIIVFDAKCNEAIIGDNIIHASSWSEIYKIITGKELN